jgi:hypothetical protein
MKRNAVAGFRAGVRSQLRDARADCGSGTDIPALTRSVATNVRNSCVLLLLKNSRRVGASHSLVVAATIARTMKITRS